VTEDSRKLLNVPLMLSTRVLMQNEHGQMVPDPNWHRSVRNTLEALYNFLLQRNLLKAEFIQRAPAVDELVITAGDLTHDGLTLWQSGAVNRWLASFDRSPNKSRNNYKIMEAALVKVAQGAA
jgi:hypothetical protein